MASGIASFIVLLILSGCSAGSDSGELGASTSLSESPGNRSPTADSSDHSSANLLRLARDIEARGSVGTALPLYERAAAAPDADATVLIMLGDAYAKLNRNSEAADAYRKALAKSPDLRQAQFGLATVLLRLGQVDDALTLLSKAAPLINTAEAYDRLGVAHIMAGQPTEALASFEQAYQLNSDDLDVATNLALAAALLGQDSRAVSLAQRTLNASDLKPYHRRNLIMVLSLAGQTDEAEAAGSESLDPSEVSSLVARAQQIRLLSNPQDRARALGTVRLAATINK